MVTSWVSDCCGLVGTVLGTPLFGAVVPGAVLGAVFGPPGVGPPVPAPGPDAVVDAPPLGPELAGAALVGPPAVSVEPEALGPLVLFAPPVVTLLEPLGETPGRAPDALELPLPLLAPPASEGVMDVEPVLGDGPALVVEWEPWTA